MLRLFARALLMMGTVAPLGAPLAAQQRDTVTTKPASPGAGQLPTAVSPLTQRGRFTPPLTPKRAFLYSSLLPGFGQSRLDRGTSGALFSSI